MAVTVTHIYDDAATARQVVQNLYEEGFRDDEISMVGRDTNAGITPDDENTDGAATGATLGGVAGAGAGLLAALGVIAIPGIGPLVAAGVLATTLAGAAAGAVAGGLLGALLDYGISEEDAEIYAEGIRRGGTLVSIRTADERAEQAEVIMKSFNPIDIKERGRSYRETGWTGYDPKAPTYSEAEAQAERDRFRNAAGI